jgi:hypothetical protein
MKSIYGQYLPVSVPQMIQELTKIQHEKEFLLGTLDAVRKDLLDALKTTNKEYRDAILTESLLDIESTLIQYNRIKDLS